MIATILIVGAALVWLGFETNWLTIRLTYGKPSAPYLTARHETLLLPAPVPVLMLLAPRKPKFERMICYNHKAVKSEA